MIKGIRVPPSITGSLILKKPIGVRGQPFKTMANKSKKVAKRGNIYETVSNNIQKITSPSGTVSYRVRVTEDGIRYSQNMKSLKSAKALRNEWVG